MVVDLRLSGMYRVKISNGKSHGFSNTTTVFIGILSNNNFPLILFFKTIFLLQMMVRLKQRNMFLFQVFVDSIHSDFHCLFFWKFIQKYDYVNNITFVLDTSSRNDPQPNLAKSRAYLGLFFGIPLLLTLVLAMGYFTAKVIFILKTIISTERIDIDQTLKKNRVEQKEPKLYMNMFLVLLF